MTRLSIIFFIAFILISCLEEDRIPTEYSWNQTFDLAAYLEANGNYINENYDHSIISPDELYDNLDSYLIIDIRSAVEYADAHIKNSINLNAGEIVSYLDEH